MDLVIYTPLVLIIKSLCFFLEILKKLIKLLNYKICYKLLLMYESFKLIFFLKKLNIRKIQKIHLKNRKDKWMSRIKRISNQSLIFLPICDFETFEKV